MKTYTKEILILLLGLLGAMPMLKGQIATISTKRSTPNVKITIRENYLHKIPQSELNSYLDALLQWADSGLKNNSINNPMPILPPSIKNMDVDINTEKINDVISIEITVKRLQVKIEFNLKVLKETLLNQKNQNLDAQNSA